jgi:hypothetical protein
MTPTGPLKTLCRADFLCKAEVSLKTKKLSSSIIFDHIIFKLDESSVDVLIASGEKFG